MMTIHDVLHFLADAVNVTEHVRGDIHAAITQHAVDTGAVVPEAVAAVDDVVGAVTDPASRAAKIADLEKQLAELRPAADAAVAVADDVAASLHAEGTTA